MEHDHLIAVLNRLKLSCEAVPQVEVSACDRRERRLDQIKTGPSVETPVAVLACVQR
jgi:hypothetical protein